MKMLPMFDPLAEIRRLYFATTRATIEQDFARALDLLKSVPDENEREKATVFMHGLAQMRSEWGKGPKKKPGTGSARAGAGQKNDRPKGGGPA